MAIIETKKYYEYTHSKGRARTDDCKIRANRFFKESLTGKK